MERKFAGWSAPCRECRPNVEWKATTLMGPVVKLGNELKDLDSSAEFRALVAGFLPKTNVQFLKLAE